MSYEEKEVKVGEKTFIVVSSNEGIKSGINHDAEDLKMGPGKVLVKPIPPHKITKSGIILPPKGPNKMLSLGYAVSKGKPVMHPKGYPISSDFNSGDVVEEKEEGSNDK